MANSHTKFCPSCDSFTNGKKETRGHFLIEVILWVPTLALAVWFTLWGNIVIAGLIFIPAFGYSIWRQSSKHVTCSECGAGNLIAFNSPKAKKTLGQDYETNLADFEAHRPKQLFEKLSSSAVMWLAVGFFVGIPIFMAFLEVYPKTTLLLTALGAGFYFFKKKKAVKS